MSIPQEFLSLVATFQGPKIQVIVRSVICLSASPDSQNKVRRHVRSPENKTSNHGASYVVDRQMFEKVIHYPEKAIRVALMAKERNNLCILVTSCQSISSLCPIFSSNLYHDIEPTSPVSVRSCCERRSIKLRITWAAIEHSTPRSFNYCDTQ